MNLAEVAKGADAPKRGESTMKMSQKGWDTYMAAHAQWVAHTKAEMKSQHDEALLKRALSKTKERVKFKHGQDAGNFSREITSGKVVIEVALEDKSKHEPTVSQKKERIELREAKKDLASVKSAAKVASLKLLGKRVTDLVPIKDEAKKQAQVLGAWRPLAKAEEAAAKSAAKRAAVLGGRRTDDVASVNPDANGWKVVTRKRGDRMMQASCISQNVDGKEITTHRSFVDPSVAASKQPLVAAVRKPTVGSSNK